MARLPFAPKSLAKKRRQSSPYGDPGVHAKGLCNTQLHSDQGVCDRKSGHRGNHSNRLSRWNDRPQTTDRNFGIPSKTWEHKR